MNILEIGIQEGERRGQEKTNKIIKNMLQRGMSDEEIMEITDCDFELIQKVRDES